MKKLSLVMAVMLLFLTACSSRPEAVLENVACPAQETLTGEVSIGDRWTIKEIPQDDLDFWMEMNHWEDIYISLSDNAIVGDRAVYGSRGYKNMNEFKDAHYLNELKTVNGKIKGTDNGEWGGEVKFVPPIGKGYTIVDENFQGFYIMDDRIFLFTGSPTMGSGNFYELICINGKWQARHILDLKGCPQGYLLVDDTVYLATDEALHIIKEGKIVDTIVENAFWGGLYPNSMVLANSNVYIGMRGGMVSVGLEDKAITLYLHDFRFEIK